MQYIPLNFALLRNPYSWAVVLAMGALGLAIAFRLQLASAANLPPTDLLSK